jgi:hypothetical protein
VPVYKYKSFEDARRGLWHINVNEDYYSSLKEFFKLAEKISSLKFPPGIYKFKTLEEANEQKKKILFGK